MDEEKAKAFDRAVSAALSAMDECKTIADYTPRLRQAIEQGDETAAAHYREIIGDEVNHALIFLLAIYAEAAEIEVPGDGLEGIGL
nr:MAG TPA: hypothetical protein [Caudoviricetes sp.]